MRGMKNAALVETEQGVRVHVPMKFRKQSRRKEIIVPEGGLCAGEECHDYHEALVVAISRAHRWKKLLDEGRYASISEMARALGVDLYRMARILRFTLLAPDIIEAILGGREPDGFSMKQLASKIPTLWSEQRKNYEFPPHDLP